MQSSGPVLLLDLGGVLADLGDPVSALGLQMTQREFWRVWTTSSTVRTFETGQMDVADFLFKVSAELGYSGDEPFARRFQAWQLRLYPGVDEIIRHAAASCRVALLSNTNEIHWHQVGHETQVFSTFARIFLSYETGHFKPSPQSFLQVMEFFECSPGEIIFLDDSEQNIVAARGLGIDAHRIVGFAELKRYLDCR